MAALDPNNPQVNNPELEADLTRLLSIVGRLGKLNVADIVVPTVSLGDVVTPSIEVRQPSFRSADVFTNDSQLAAPAFTILADTGPLAKGTYDIRLLLAGNENTMTLSSCDVQHRNAANTTILAGWDNPVFSLMRETITWSYEFAYEFALNERLRVVNNALGGTGTFFYATIFARRRT